MNGWRAGFGGRFGRAIIPGAVADDMSNILIIDQSDALAFIDGDGRLRKVCSAHVNGWRATAAAAAAITTATIATTTTTITTAAARGKQNSNQTQDYETY